MVNNRLPLASGRRRWHSPGMASFPDAPRSGLDGEPVAAAIMAGGGVQRVPSPKLTLFIRRAFLPPELCAALVARIDAGRRPSTLTDHDGVATFRTSETCDLDPADPAVIATERLIGALTGLDPRRGEPMQGQRYAIGQEFKAHTDYFEPSGVEYDRHCGVAGNRTWTVMIYLNEPEAVDKIIQPETGKLVAWNNRRADGTLNAATIHQGIKVRAGVKYVVTKWFREQAWG